MAKFSLAASREVERSEVAGWVVLFVISICLFLIVDEAVQLANVIPVQQLLATFE